MMCYYAVGIAWKRLGEGIRQDLFLSSYVELFPNNLYSFQTQNHLHVLAN